MALKSSEVLKGNFPASRRYSSSHPGIDLVCPVTTCKSRYNGFIVEVKRNPKGVDWGLFIRVKYNNSNVIGAYAHLSRAIVKVGQKVVKGQIIGYTGNTGYTISRGVVCNERKNCGLHLHYSEHTTGKLVWLDPDKTNVKQKEVDPMADIRRSFIDSYFTVMAKKPSEAIINTFLKNPEKRVYIYVQKKFLKPKYVLRTAYNKVVDAKIAYATRIRDGKTLLGTVRKQLENLQKDFKDFKKKADDQIDEQAGKIVALDEKLKRCEADSGNELDTKLPEWDIIWGFIKERVTQSKWWKQFKPKRR